jgi:hypothetical protein
MMRGNWGEWSEAYAFLKLLVEGELQEVEADLSPKSTKTIVLDLLRDDSSGLKLFKTRQNSYESQAGFITRGEIVNALAAFPSPSSSRNLGVFEIPAVEHVLSRLGISAIKAASKEKIDIKGHFASASGHGDKLLGYSIKSELGSASTLLNASGHTLFKYAIGTDVKTASILQEKSGPSKVKAFFRALKKHDIGVTVRGPKSKELKSNMLFFGGELEVLLSNMLLSYYQGQPKGLKELAKLHDVNEIQQKRNKFQLGQFLKAIALGMVPATPWQGELQAYGGYIIVQKDGSLMSFPLENEDVFRNYLIEKSYFDTPSVSRHKFGSLYEAEGELFIDLSMQIRFR